MYQAWRKVHGRTQMSGAGFVVPAAGGGWPFTAYWRLDESSGNAADSVGTQTLTNTNTVTYSAGKINNGANFVASSSQGLIRTSETTLNTTNTTFEIVLWFKPAAINHDTTIIAKDDATGQEYRLRFGASSSFRLQLYTPTETYVDSSVFPANGNWYFVDFYWNSSNNEAGIAVNNGAFTTGTIARDSQTSGSFSIGQRTYSGFQEFTDGQIDAVGFVKGSLLTTQQRTDLYNGGAGLQPV